MLDTWFSSGLWPFSTLGWPENAPELARYYPTDVLVTGFDIIFFWVARMMMLGIHIMGEVPFRTVYIHGLVRDERGQKMSKSKGNIIDPLELIDRYGADALRFTICALTGPGRDVKLGAARVEGYRGFVTKLWNAARFCEMNAVAPQRGFRSRRRASDPRPLAAGCGERRDRRGDRGPGGVPDRRLRRRRLSFRLEHFLRLVPGARQARARRAGHGGGRRDPRGRGACARHHPAPAAPGDAVRDRGVVGSFRLWRAQQPDPRALAGRRRRHRRARRARRARLGGAAHLRDPRGAERDEHPPRHPRADPAARGRARNPRPRRKLGRGDPPAGARANPSRR